MKRQRVKNDIHFRKIMTAIPFTLANFKCSLILTLAIAHGAQSFLIMWPMAHIFKQQQQTREQSDDKVYEKLWDLSHISIIVEMWRKN